MVGMIRRVTKNFQLQIPNYDVTGWGFAVNNNFDLIDSLIFSITGISNVSGEWRNNTAYAVGTRVIDPDTGGIYQVNVAHTSASSGSFAADRAAHPTYWSILLSPFAFRGAWASGIQYRLNEFLYSGHRYGVANQTFISGASYDADVAAGKIITLADLTASVTAAANSASAAAGSASAAAGSAAAAAASAAAAATFDPANFYTKTQADGRFGQLAAVNHWTTANVFHGSLISAENTNVGRVWLGSDGLHALLFDSLAYRMNSGGLILGGNLHAEGDSVDVNAPVGAYNTHYFHAHGGIRRSATLYEGSSSSILWALYNSSGAYVRQMNFRESDGRLAVDGPILASGSNITAGGSLVSDNGVYAGGTGGAMFATDGNIIFKAGMASAFGTSLFTALNDRIKNDGGVYGINITGNADTAFKLWSGGSYGGPLMQFNWSGLGGQPQWVWGGDAGSTGTNMYVYNPSGFNVDMVDGYHATDFWRNNQAGGGSTSGWQKFPSGLIVQWGSAVVTVDAGGQANVPFSASFPTQCTSVTACSGNFNSSTDVKVYDTMPNSYFLMLMSGIASTAVRVNYTAWGY